MRASFSLFVSAWSFKGFWASATAFSSYSFMLEHGIHVEVTLVGLRFSMVSLQELREDGSHYLLTIISSPSPVARHSEPATLVAIFSSGSVIIGTPAHNTSVPVVCALHSGLQIEFISNPFQILITKCQQFCQEVIYIWENSRIKKEICQSTASDMFVLHSDVCEYDLIRSHSF